MENQIEIINQRDVELLEKNRKINLQKLFTPEGMDLIIAEIENEVADFQAFHAVVETKEGRAKIISMAAKIAKCKSPIKNLATELKEESKKLIDGVNSQWNRYEKAMDELRDAVRKPVDEIEEKEAKILKERQDRLNDLEYYKNANSCSIEIDDKIKFFKEIRKKVEELSVYDWGDFKFKAETLSQEVILILELKIADSLKQKEQEAELIQLKKEKAERDKKDAEKRIAKEAEERAKKEAEESIKRAEQAKIDAENRARESERIAKDEAQKFAIEAVEKERQRVAEIARKEAEASEKREANKRHRNKIHGEISIAFLEALGIYYKDVSNEDIESVENTHEMCHKIIDAISENKISHLTINY